MALNNDKHYTTVGYLANLHVLIKYNLVGLRATKDLAFERSDNFFSLISPALARSPQKANVDISIKRR